ncbi:MAG TPA: preprotein translocase subunit YajC, partial [Acidimicrobiales bacterium]|nr:preprotein translocase subunit YajC [Acidimicrobiales bacterium]
ASATSTTTSTSKTSGSSVAPLLVIVAIFAVVYFLFIRPRSQRLRQQQGAARQLSIGDEVMTAGGIYGRIVAMDDDAVEVEVSPGVVMTFTRRAVNPRPAPGSQRGPSGRGGFMRPPPQRQAQPVEEDPPWLPPAPSSGGSDGAPGDGPVGGSAVPPDGTPGEGHVGGSAVPPDGPAAGPSVPPTPPPPAV